MVGYPGKKVKRQSIKFLINSLTVTLSVLSMALVRTCVPSGLSDIPVTVSVWPPTSVSSAFLRESQILIMLSIPAVTSWVGSSPNCTAVT